MRSTRQITLIILLALLVAPGLLIAAPTSGHRASRAIASAPTPQSGILSSVSAVWNLLTNYAKSVASLTSSGGATTNDTGTSGNGDNGGMLDPSGAK